MRKTLLQILALAGLLVAAGCSSGATPTRSATHAFRCPITRTEAVVDDYHGTEVADPYRWLEDQDGEATAAWVATQSAATEAFLETLPTRDSARARLAELWNHERFTTPTRHGDWWIYRKNDGLQNQSVIYRTKSLDEEGEVLLDPNTMSEDGTTSVGALVPNKAATLAAYSVSGAGSDWQEWRVLDLATGQPLDDVLSWCKFSGVSWSLDGLGFFYQRYPAPAEGATYEAKNENAQLCYHVVGTAQDDDRVVYERPDEPRWGFGPRVTDDGRYLMIQVWAGTDRRNRVAYADLESEPDRITPLLWELDAEYQFVHSVGSRVYFKTDHSAPRGRIVSFDLTQPQPEHWTEVVAETRDTLSGATVVADRLVLTYIHDAHHRIETHGLAGASMGAIDLPVLGSVGGIAGKAEDRSAFFSLSSFTMPSRVYRYDFDQEELSVWRAPELPLDGGDVVTKQVWYQSEDGTRVPMFVVHKKGLRLDGSTPTLLYGYGGFNISILPRFSVQTAVWVERGGIYAQPSLRGGGEFGEAWHAAGMLENKQKVFDDFVSAAEYLIRNDYTSREKLAINGRSNGGLLVGACLTQRPDLFGAALPEVGVLDMLRYHQFTIGWAWIPEYGSSEDPEMFPVLHAYSPLHNVRPGTRYPPTMVMTGDHDDRVLPGHSYKFAAAMQAAQGGTAPILARIETSAGHGAGTPVGKQVEAAADRIAFLDWALGRSVP